MADYSNIDWTNSNRAIARELGVNESTVRRKRARMGDNHDPFFTDVPTEIITSRGKSYRTDDGWEKITYLPNKKALLDARSYDDLDLALADYKPQPRPRHTNEHYAVFNLADAQIGGVDVNGGTPETLARIRNAYHKFADRVMTEKPTGIIFADGGDPIENCMNTPQQRFTNDLDVPEQIRVFRRIALEGIKLLAPLVQDFHYVAVTSNHGAFRTGYQEQGGTSDADFGVEIAHQLSDVCSEHSSQVLRDVSFHVPDAWQETVEIEVANTKMAFTHGHLSGNIKKHADWWAKIDHGRLPGWDADILSVSHYHTPRLENSGDGRWIIGNTSCDNGSQWFTKKSGESSIAGVTAYNILDGMWSGLEIL